MKVLEESFQFDKSIIFDLFPQPAWRSSHSCRGQAEERRAQLRSVPHKTLQRTKLRKSPPQCRNFILTHPILIYLYNYHHDHLFNDLPRKASHPGPCPELQKVLPHQPCQKKRI